MDDPSKIFPTAHDHTHPHCTNGHEPRAAVHLLRVAGDGGDVGHVEVGLRLVAVLVRVAELAVDVAVGALRAQLVVEGALAHRAREALLVVQPRLGRHLLRLEHLLESTTLQGAP